MEPVAPGAYARALEKRGPGLHHLGIDVPDAEAYAMELARAGWLLHPRSLETFRKTKTLWLARPGIGLLVEVQQREAQENGPPFVKQLDIPVAPENHFRIDALGIASARGSAVSAPRIQLEEGIVPVLQLG
jgi:hypothetical protein